MKPFTFKRRLTLFKVSFLALISPWHFKRLTVKLSNYRFKASAWHRIISSTLFLDFSQPPNYWITWSTVPKSVEKYSLHILHTFIDGSLLLLECTRNTEHNGCFKHILQHWSRQQFTDNKGHFQKLTFFIHNSSIKCSDKRRNSPLPPPLCTMLVVLEKRRSRHSNIERGEGGPFHNCNSRTFIKIMWVSQDFWPWLSETMCAYDSWDRTFSCSITVFSSYIRRNTN